MDEIALRERIPESALPHPKGAYNRSKYVFWKMIYPLHNTGRDILLSVGLIHHPYPSGRQDFMLGILAPDKSVEAFVKHLGGHGFFNHFIAWKDSGEIVSVRRPVDFEWQYHLRVFADGEVRGHYEYTPESHPIWHYYEVRQEERREEFLNFLGDWIVPGSTSVHTSPSALSKN